MAAKVQDRTTDWANVYAPERLRWRAKRDDDRGADDTRVGHGHQSPATVRQRIQPITHSGNEVHNRFPAMGRLSGIGQPEREFGRTNAVEHAAAPRSAVQIGQQRLGLGSQPKEFSGLPGPLLGCADRGVDNSEIDGGINLTLSEGIQGLIPGKPSGCHRVRHRVGDEGQPDDLTHVEKVASAGLRLPSSTFETSAANTSPMVAHMTTCTPSEYSRNW